MGDLSDVKVMWDGAAIAELLRGPQGPVALHLQERGTVIQIAARVQVGKQTHRLENSIVKRMVDQGEDIGIMVGCDTVPYALLHHEGTEPHVILPKKPGGVLVFTVNGTKVFTTKVNHPGTKPNPYLSDHLHLAIE